jgi:hypothetical protein
MSEVGVRMFVVNHVFEVTKSIIHAILKLVNEGDTRIIRKCFDSM